MTHKTSYFYIFMFALCVASCNEDSEKPYVNVPTASPLQIPQLFQDLILDPVIPSNNPQTEEGISLGKKTVFRPHFIRRQHPSMCRLSQYDQRIYR